ncbi:MAG: DNA polymerase III subunit delta [Oscillospiraceae bacterium]|nr:DNA polymerase III subunit delta [Oscillospiraceae bacterium]
MAKLEPRKLAEQLKAKQISNLYYIYGSDTAQVETCVRALLKTVSGGDSSAVTKLDGTGLNVSELADEAELCPMFAEYNCIYVHDLNMETIREDMRKAILELLKNVAPQTVLIFDVTGFDIFGGKTGKNKKPTDKNKKLIDYIEKNGTTVLCELKNQVQLASDIMIAARKRGCTMEKPAAMTLAELCGCQGLVIRQEMGKLCAYADGGEITEQLVREMVTPQLETTVYMLTDAILKHRSAETMHRVEELLAMRVEMPYLMATVAGSLIDVQRACAARKAGKRVEDVMQDFGYRMSFIVERAFRTSMGESEEHLARCLSLLCKAETKLHSAAVDEQVLFEETIIEMLRK